MEIIYLNVCQCVVMYVYVYREDDSNWPEPDRVGKQELEVKVGGSHIAFTVCPGIMEVLIKLTYLKS